MLFRAQLTRRSIFHWWHVVEGEADLAFRISHACAASVARKRFGCRMTKVHGNAIALELRATFLHVGIAKVQRSTRVPTHDSVHSSEPPLPPSFLRTCELVFFFFPFEPLYSSPCTESSCKPPSLCVSQIPRLNGLPQLQRGL